MADFEIKDGVLIKYHGHSQEVVVPEGIIAIGDSAFKDNSSMVSIELPQSLINIGEEAFCNCRGFTELVFPPKLASIGARAFDNCESLKKITLSKTIKFIGWCAFGDTKIKDIYYGGALEEFGAIKTRDPIFGVLYPFSDSSSSSSTFFGMYSPVLHCKDVTDSLYYLLNKLQGLLEENDQ